MFFRRIGIGLLSRMLVWILRIVFLRVLVDVRLVRVRVGVMFIFFFSIGLGVKGSMCMVRKGRGG